MSTIDNFESRSPFFFFFFFFFSLSLSLSLSPIFVASPLKRWGWWHVWSDCHLLRQSSGWHEWSDCHLEAIQRRSCVVWLSPLEAIQRRILEDAPVVQFMYLVFTRMPGKNYVVVFYSLVCWFIPAEGIGELGRYPRETEDKCMILEFWYSLCSTSDFLIRTASGKEGGRNTETEVTTRAQLEGLQKQRFFNRWRWELMMLWRSVSVWDYLTGPQTTLSHNYPGYN